MEGSPLAQALGGFERHLAQMSERDWQRATPCAEWDVRALVNHVLGEVLWIPPLVAGQTMEEVGDRFDGDVIGADVRAAWRSAANAALVATDDPQAYTRTVHLSFGDFPGSYYLGQVTSDVVIHTWDLAQGLGHDAHLDDALVAFVDSTLMPEIEAWRAAGVLGPVAEGGGDSPQDRMLRATGRSPDWSPPA